MSSSSSSIKVLIRIRPSADETEAAISVDDNNTVISLRDNRSSNGVNEFSFDRILRPEIHQEAVYEALNIISSKNNVHMGKSLLEDVCNGINCCIIAYGQTSSGKTFTMYGPDKSPSPQVLSQSMSFRDGEKLVEGKDYNVDRTMRKYSTN